MGSACFSSTSTMFFGTMVTCALARTTFPRSSASFTLSKFSGAFFNRPLDIVARHTIGARRHHRGTQAWIGVDVTAADARRHGNLLNEFSKQFAFSGVLGGFFVLDGTPLRVT